MAEIRLEGIEKRFPDGTQAVRPTSLTIADGELFILVGPSGCGKSTLLNLIVGLERPTAGAILVNGRAVTESDPKDRNMAMVFQSYALYPHMTVRQNIAFPLRLARLPKAEIAERVAETARLLELGALLDRKPAALSGGQRQRVAMGRAIVRRPAAFLLDEPRSNLDARLRGQMRAELLRLQRLLGTTTVYVTHDQTEAMTLGDRVAVLDRGEVQQVGAPRELYERPANLFVAGFVGSPPMNLLPARIDGERLYLPMVDVPLPPALGGQLGNSERRELVAGIRPEHIADAATADGPSGAVFSARVEMVEWLGAEVLVHCQLTGAGPGALAAAPEGQGAGARLVARVTPESRVAAGESIRLSVAAERISLFDAASGRRLAAQAGPAG